MLLAFALLLVSYLLGSLSGSLLLGKLRGVDIRMLGSGNAGGSNALRTMGWKFALLTVLVDVGKGALAAGMAWQLLPTQLQPGGTYACVLAAAIGHVWPVFHGFRGGKGAATVLGGLAVAWPQALLPALATWLLSMLCSGYVGLSTMLAGASVLLFAVLMHADRLQLGFALAIALLLVATHRSNVSRMRAGCEPRSERMRVLGKMFARKVG